MPASDMMFAVTPSRYIGMNASSTEIGIVTIGTIADGMCQRKMRMTSADDDQRGDQLVA